MTLTQLLFFSLLISIAFLIAVLLKVRKKSIQLDELHNEVSNYILSIQTSENLHHDALRELETKNDDTVKSYNNIFEELEKERKDELAKANWRISELETIYAPLLGLDNEIIKRELNISELKISFE